MVASEMVLLRTCVNIPRQQIIIIYLYVVISPLCFVAALIARGEKCQSDRTQRINYCRSDVFIKFTKRTNSFAGIKA